MRILYLSLQVFSIIRNHPLSKALYALSIFYSDLPVVAMSFRNSIYQKPLKNIKHKIFSCSNHTGSQSFLWYTRVRLLLIWNENHDLIGSLLYTIFTCAWLLRLKEDEHMSYSTFWFLRTGCYCLMDCNNFIFFLCDIELQSY